MIIYFDSKLNCVLKKLATLFITVLLSVSVANASEPLTFQLKRLVDGKPTAVTEKSWQGKYLLMAVGYTGCPDICPTTLLDIRQALHALDKTPAEAAKVQPLFVTIDPESDSLADITRYTAYFDPRIIGLRADNFTLLDDVVEQLHADYGYYLNDKPVSPPNLPQGYTVMHSTYIYLYSPDAKLLDTFPYNMPGAELAKRILTNLK